MDIEDIQTQEVKLTLDEEVSLVNDIFDKSIIKLIKLLEEPSI